MSRPVTVFEMGLREYARTPVLLVLLLVLPAYFVFVFTALMPAEPVVVTIPIQGPTRVSMSRVIPVLMAPMATAFVGGAAGLFLMHGSRTVDRRLAVVGVRLPTIVLARAGVLVSVATVAGLISAGAVSLTHAPERPGWYLLAAILAGLTYGGIGALIGLVLNRLAGVYLVLFGPLLDLFLAQNPLAEDPSPIAPYLPGYAPTQLAFDAAFTPGIEPAPLWRGGTYLLLVATLLAAAFGRRLRAG